MFRKLLATLALTFASLLTQAQTVSVTVDLKSMFGTSQTTKAQACFSLVDIGGQQIPDPRVTGSGVIIPTSSQCLSPDGSGRVATNMYANDQITPSGSLYSVQYTFNGRTVHGDLFQFLLADGSENLNSKTPITSIPLITPPGGDQIYARLDTGNQPFTGTIFAPAFDNFQYVGPGANTTLAAAYSALPSTGGTIFVAPGTYVGSLTFTGGKPARVVCSGRGATILIPSASNTPVIQGPSSGGQADDSYVIGCSVKAHASGSTGPAIDLNGFRNSTFENIEYLSNAGANFNSFFHLSANNLCYGNTIRHPRVDTQSGPATIFLFDNGGTSNANFNANNNTIEDMWINANTGITTVINARRSADVVINRGLVEGNTGAVVLIPGTNTTMFGVWLESNASTSIVGTTGSDGSSNSVHLLDNHISTSQTFTIQSSSDFWEITGNTPDANLTVTDSSGGGTSNSIQVGRTQRCGVHDCKWLFKNSLGINASLAIGDGAGALPFSGIFWRDETNSRNVAAFPASSGNLALFGKINDIGLSSTMGMTVKAGSGGGNYTGTNTTYANVDTTNLCTTVVVPSGWRLTVTASMVVESVTAAVAQNFSVSDIGTSCGGGGTTPMIGSERIVTPPAAGVFDVGITLQGTVGGDGATHAISVQAKTSNGADAWGIQNSSTSASPTMILTLMPSN